MELNKFIDFDGIFEHLFQEQKEVLRQYVYEATHYGKILSFYDHKEDFEINVGECEYDNKYIRFVYTQSSNDGNESCNQSTTSDYDIIYDFALSEFTSCEYEQG
jgi:hypothetical protein